VNVPNEVLFILISVFCYQSISLLAIELNFGREERRGGVPPRRGGSMIKAVTLILVIGANVGAQPIKKVPIQSTSAASGREMFAAYCAVCHGTAGKGDGPVAKALKNRPVDLTTLSRNNGGTFPQVRVMGYITGEETVAALVICRSGASCFARSIRTAESFPIYVSTIWRSTSRLFRRSERPWELGDAQQQGIGAACPWVGRG